MPTTYTNNNGLALPATGELDGTWGSTVNTALTALLDQSLDAWALLSLTGTSSNLAITDGVSSDGRCRIILCTGTLTANHTITVTPNDAAKWYFVYNATSGGFSVIIKQGTGSGTTVTVSNGYWSIVRVDGTGTNANVTRIGESFEIGGTLKTANVTVSGTITAGAFTVSGIGVGDGTAGSPALQFNSDGNTGLFRPGSDIIGFSAGGTERARITTTGFQMVDGSAASPSIAPTSDPDSGLYSAGTNSLGIATAGANRVTLDTTALTTTLPNRTADGSAAAPAFSFSGDTDTGVHRPGTNILAIDTAGSERARVDASGNLAIGSTTGYQKLTVQGQGVFLDDATSSDPGDGAGPALRVGYVTGSDYGYVASSETGVTIKPMVLFGSYIQHFNTRVLIGGASAGTSPAASAALEIQSTSAGFLPPVMTTVQRDAIASPAAGLLIYNSTASKHQGYNGSTWNDLY